VGFVVQMVAGQTVGLLDLTPCYRMESYVAAALLVLLAVEIAGQQVYDVLGRQPVEQDGEVVGEPAGVDVLVLAQAEKSVAKDKNPEQELATGFVQTAAAFADADPILLVIVAAAVATDWLALDW